MNAEALAPLETLDADESGLIVTSGPATRDNHAFADWFREMQFAGWETFGSLPMPHRKDEAWRFASVKNIDLSPYARPLPVDDAAQAELIARSRGLSHTAARMIFANDKLLHREVLDDELEAKGVLLKPLERAAAEHEELFKSHFMTQEVVLGSKKFAALHKSQVRTGSFLYVPRNIEIELPVEIFHWVHGTNGSVFPHTLLVVGENSKITLVEYFESAKADAPGLACGVNDLYLMPGAKLTYVNVQNWSRRVLSFQINSTLVGRDAAAINMALNLGGSYARTESVSRLIAPGGRSDMLAVSVADGTQEFDQRTLQDHREPNTTSDLLYKNSLDDATRTIFAGLIRVEPHAHRTDAYQKVRNLLLSDDAEANSMPGLEILADEVRCTHGATSGQIGEEDMFYLLSRGIPKKVAQQLIVFGFLNEVFQRLGCEPVEARLRSLVEAKFFRG
jgi:Fe-S cluster assembly protein SufD